MKNPLISEGYAVIFALSSVIALVGSSWYLPNILKIQFLAPIVLGWAVIQRRIAAGPSCRSIAKQRGLLLKSRVAIVTGANSGIGYYTALRLAELGCKVILTCRSPTLVTETILKMKAEFESRKSSIYAAKCIPVVDTLDLVDRYSLELDNFDSITSFVKKFVASGLPCHILVNNAGMMVKHLQFSTHNPNLELHTAVNFFGPVLLTELLMPIIKVSHGRVVNVASEAHRMPEVLGKGRECAEDEQYLLNALKAVNKGSSLSSGPLKDSSIAQAFGRYGASKLCNVYYSHYIANVHKVPVCALHPGCVATGFTRDLLFPWFKTIFDIVSLLILKSNEEGAETTLFCCLLDEEKLLPIPHPSVKGCVVSRYFADCRDGTRNLLRPLGWNIKAAMNICNWALEEVTKKK